MTKKFSILKDVIWAPFPTLIWSWLHKHTQRFPVKVCWMDSIACWYLSFPAKSVLDSNILMVSRQRKMSWIQILSLWFPDKNILELNLVIMGFSQKISIGLPALPWPEPKVVWGGGGGIGSPAPTRTIPAWEWPRRAGSVGKRVAHCRSGGCLAGAAIGWEREAAVRTEEEEEQEDKEEVVVVVVEIERKRETTEKKKWEQKVKESWKRYSQDRKATVTKDKTFKTVRLVVVVVVVEVKEK